MIKLCLKCDTVGAHYVDRWGKVRGQCNRCNMRYKHRHRRAHKQVEKNKLRVYLRQKKYGVTPADFSALLLKQSGACAICSGAFDAETNVPHIDHCHKTGKVRGLLCIRCNGGIGLLGDSPEMLDRAQAYLRSHNAQG